MLQNIVKYEKKLAYSIEKNHLVKSYLTPLEISNQCCFASPEKVFCPIYGIEISLKS